MKRIFTIFILVWCINYLYSNLEVLSQSPEQVILEFSIGDYAISQTNDFTYIDTHGLGYSDKQGAPSLPEITYYIGVPSSGGISVNTTQTEIKKHSLSQPILPTPKVDRGTDLSEYDWVINEQLYKTRSSSFIRKGERQLFRYNYVVPITIHPVLYNYSGSELQVVESMIIVISISGDTAKRNPIRDSVDLSYNIVNYDDARNWQILKQIQVEYAPFSKSDFWYRFEIPQNGMYKLTADDLSILPLNDIDPDELRIFTNGGSLLTDAESEKGNPFREVPLLVFGEESGIFGEKGSIIFYGENRDGIEKNHVISGTVDHYFNPYSGNGVYWLTYGGGFPNPPLRMRTQEYHTYQVIRNSCPEIFHYESENVRREHFGFTWFHSMLTGLSTTNHNYNFTVNHVDTTRPQTITLSVQGEARTPSSVTYSLSMALNNNIALSRVNWQGSNYRTFSDSGHFLQNGSNNAVMTIYRTASRTIFFDYFNIDYYRYLVKEDTPLYFRSDGDDYSKSVLYRIEGSLDNLRAYEIRETHQTSILPISPAEDDSAHDFEIIGRGKSRYAIVKDGEYYNVVNFAQIIPREIAEINRPIDSIIITPTAFYNYAEQLASLYQAEENLSTLIVDQQDIFNQFNSGMPDPNAIRLFIKHAFYNYPSNEYSSLSSITLLGSGTIDWRNFSGQASQKNKIMIFHKGSNTSDDFFVDLTGNDLPDVAIGRITGQNVREMDIIIEKIHNYRQEPTFGLWRNTTLIVADDEFTTSHANEAIHSIQAQSVSRMLPPAVITDKLFGIEYPFDAFGNKPTAREDIIDRVNEGRLVWYYIGHGSYDLMGHESYFRATDINSLNNIDKLPLFIAASCDVGKYDYFAYNSLSERLLAYPYGGSIASLAATGLSSPTPNASLMESFLTSVINDYQAPGISLVNAKHRYHNQSFNNRRYSYLGDPLLRINPPLRSRNIQLAQNADSLFAYQKVNIEGTFNTNQTWTNDNIEYRRKGSDIRFTESNYLQMKQRNMFNMKRDNKPISNIGQDITDVLSYSSEYPLSYRVQASDTVIHYTKWGNIYFRGKSEVVNGDYEASFIIPGDIKSGNEGRIIAYYFDKNERQDYVSYYYPKKLTNIAYKDAVTDTIPPEISIWLETENFRDGDIVGPNPTLFASITDESGINILGELGHNILLMMDEYSTPIDVTDGFVYDVNSHKSGLLTWQLSELEEGSHRLHLIVFDNFNNPSVAEVAFKVSRAEDVIISDLLPYPNPISDTGYFTFKLNETADITIAIYTIRGRKIRTLRSNGIPGFNQVYWDGRDQDGSRLANNTYLYKIQARHASTGKRSEEICKVIILR